MKSQNIGLRLSYIDACRGFAILLVVIGHVIQYIYRPNDFDSKIGFRMIYAFHMPLFFFLSGYVSKLGVSSMDAFFRISLKRLFQLLVPFVVWGLFQNRICFNEPIYGFILRPDHGLWFLFHLFIITLFSNTILFCVNKIPLGGGRIKYVVAFILGYLFLNRICEWNTNDYCYTGMLMYYFPYYASGAIIGVYKETICKNKFTLYIGIFSILCYILLSSLWYRVPKAIESDAPNIVHYLNSLLSYRYLTAYMGIIGVIAIFSQVRSLSCAFFIMLGSCSLGIYAIHLEILNTADIVHLFRNEFWGSFISFIISSVLLMYITLIAIRLVRKNKYLSLILIGDVDSNMFNKILKK